MVGFDIGGTKCAVCVGNRTADGVEIVDKRVIPTDHTVTPYEMLERMCRLAEEMTGDLSRIGISCGGPLDSRRGVILSPPNLPGWDDVHIVEYLQGRYPGAKAALQNDANACALAEWMCGAGRGADSMVFLTFGSGMGAGLILNGRLYAGASDMAGEVGHVRLENYGPVGYGKAGSFEGFCSGNGIAALGRMLATERLQMGGSVSYCESWEQLTEITAKKIAECAYAGHEDAKAVYRLCGEKLGQGLAMLVDILNPQRIVIGSVFQRSESLLRESMEAVLKRECLSYALEACRVVPAALTENIGDYAALTVAASIGE